METVTSCTAQCDATSMCMQVRCKVQAHAEMENYVYSLRNQLKDDAVRLQYKLRTLLPAVYQLR